MLRLTALFALIVLAAIIVIAPGCAQARVQPPVPAEPTVLRPAKPQTAHKAKGQVRQEDPGQPTDFILDRSHEITPPQGCLELRQRTGNPTAC